ncbi:DUF4124 domain-containing protein [Sulfurirhabdus autotrophica]|uniref:Uncharacterized protein DUF4124 n=1 Tax=Sulfurirhabdus autotrophica TaxID=1706046 RepID=A0A4R3Y4F1_9PROT|nr:DUF4124 domain-containing protein [Sulfurirhabdus autotrophica]TCV86432.1 uncharacterized protein DUF4124 [Sulfurirhabdus autotrophica]
MKQNVLRACGFLLLIGSLSTQAEMYKQVDDKGQVTYSNVPIKGAKKVDLAPITILPPTKAKSAGASAKGSAVEVQDGPEKNAKKQAVEESLVKEQTSLVKAKLAMEEEKNRSGTLKNKVDGKEVARKAVNRNEERIKELQDEIALREKNIELLKQDLATLQ